MTCIVLPISKAREDEGLKLPFVTAPFMPGVKITGRCATGAEGLGTTLRIAIASAIVATAHAMDTMVPIVFTPTTFATKTKTVRSIPLTLTLSADTVLLLTMTLTSEGR